jgi:hypothetical protein
MAVKMGHTVIRHFDDGVFCGHYIDRNNCPLLGSHTIDHPSNESDWIWARRFIREQAAIISTADLDLLSSDIRRGCAPRFRIRDLSRDDSVEDLLFRIEQAKLKLRLIQERRQRIERKHEKAVKRLADLRLELKRLGDETLVE